MPLFGRAFRLDQGPYKPEPPPKQGGSQPVTSAGGFMGAFRRKSLPRTLQIIGAGLQDIGGDGNLDAFAANEAEQQRLAAVEAATQQRTIDSKDDRAADTQEAQYTATRRQQLEQYIASLPPDQQLLARLNPEGFVNGMMRHRYPAPRRSGEDGIADDDGWTYHD